MDRATRTEGLLSLRAGRSPVRLLALAATTAAVLLTVLGCAAGQAAPAVNTPLTNHPPLDPSATPGALSTHEVAASVPLVGDRSRQVTATCPQDEIALSGGWAIDQPAGARVYAANIVGNSWVVSFFPIIPGGPTNVTAYVECLRGAGGTITAVQRTVTESIAPSVPSDQVDRAGGDIRTCQTGEGLVGGGFDFGSAAATTTLELEASLPWEYLHLLGWSFKVWNFDKVAHEVTFTVQCLTTTRTGSQVHDTAQAGAGISPNLSATTTADCPAGTMVAGGGFTYSLPGARTTGYSGNEYSQHATATGWQSSTIAFTADTDLHLVQPQAAAVCMTLA
jgi:hypothetical protein